MNVKVDENLPRSVALALRDRGLDMETVQEEGLDGTPDLDLIDVARSEDRMIFNLDRGFGDLRSYPPGAHPGIMVFRSSTTMTSPTLWAPSRLSIAALSEFGDLIEDEHRSENPTFDPTNSPIRGESNGMGWTPRRTESEVTGHI